MIIFWAVFLVLGCQDKYEELMQTAGKKFPFISAYKWQMISAWDNGGSLTVEAKAIRGDTSAVLTIVSYKPTGDKQSGDSIVLHEFHKSYESRDSLYSMSIASNGAVKYLYRYCKSNPEILDFLLGYHTFKYERGGMNEFERQFYLNHQDSLKHVAGGRIHAN